MQTRNVRTQVKSLRCVHMIAIRFIYYMYVHVRYVVLRNVVKWFTLVLRCDYHLVYVHVATRVNMLTLCNYYAYSTSLVRNITPTLCKLYFDRYCKSLPRKCSSTLVLSQPKTSFLEFFSRELWAERSIKLILLQTYISTRQLVSTILHLILCTQNLPKLTSDLKWGEGGGAFCHVLSIGGHRQLANTKLLRAKTFAKLRVWRFRRENCRGLDGIWVARTCDVCAPRSAKVSHYTVSHCVLQLYSKALLTDWLCLTCMHDYGHSKAAMMTWSHMSAKRYLNKMIKLDIPTSFMQSMTTWARM